jgi:hypothetical protein
LPSKWWGTLGAFFGAIKFVVRLVRVIARDAA